MPHRIGGLVGLCCLLCAAPGWAQDEESSEPDSVFFVDALGVLTFGLTPGYEVSLGSASLVARLRIMNLGALSYLALPADEADDYFDWGVGAALGFRTYPMSHMRGFYVGGSAEIDHYVTADEDDDLAEYTTTLLTPFGEAGYRWIFGKFVLSVGGGAGLSIPIAASDEPIGDNGCVYDNSCEEERDMGFVVLANVELGWAM